MKDEEIYQGVLIPRSEFGDDRHLVLKLNTGYNVGILVTKDTKIERIGVGAKPAFSTPPLPKQKENLPRVAILSTGGTIASRVDYRTGGVRPALTANDLYSVVPELSEIAFLDARILFSVFSENITVEHWSEAAKSIAKFVKNGVAGVVVAHGTDTMGYTAAALSFALQNLPVPVILVGSQRSADRPSSDAATNLIGAVKAAASAPFAEVAIAMHETVSDDSIIFHRGVKARKCHTSRRDAFKSINVPPLARLKDGKIRMLTRDYQKRDSEKEVIVEPRFNEEVTLIKFHPGMGPVIDWHVENGYKGIILEGTGLGHVSNRYFSAIRKAITKKIIVGITSQCIWGRVNMNVYDTGRDLLEIGVIPLKDMLPETALVKMMWVLGQTKDFTEARKLLSKNIANEFSERTVFGD
ncbi:MAG: Glu-tRNA(Gln) amidotransferase subunit GatD [Candidatus Bathyarchaeota archaeon]|nr:MAG: Glu-tRNA(Gln) amidotransferase subunit GatD [Candidatus Bathyarchaeota archaeon]